MNNYPGTIFEFVDQSAISPIPVNEPIVKPLFMAAITSDKGPEDYRVVEGDEFFKLYGDNISFEKHGQPLLQAANIINAGGSLFVKRVVDPDSTLANLVVSAQLSKTEVQKTNAAGQPIYKTSGGEETTEAGSNTPVMISQCKIKYITQSVENIKSIEEVSAAALSAATTPEDDGTGTYPLFVVADNGRCSSNKYFQIAPDYVSSKSTDYAQYTFKVIENNTAMESIQFAIDPDTVDGANNVSMKARIAKYSSQIKVDVFEENIRNFITAIASITSLTLEDVKGMDVLFGKTRRGVALSNIVVDPTGINLTHPYGLHLENGLDGVFTGSRIYNNPLYATEMAKVFDGSFSNVIYDLDNYKIDAIVDANYPAAVKRAIENLVTFREDCVYFRDLGLGLKTLAQILEADNASEKNKFCASYLTSYDIIDPYSKKQITVTMLYDLAALLVEHFNNGVHHPLAGQLYNMILTNAIEGSVNFIPAITPAENQKEVLADAHINYASYYDGALVIETLFTSQEKSTQFSYINNILAIQEVIKAIRTRCPKIRYSFMDGDDLEKYKEDVQSVMDKYTNNFMSMSLEYISDATYISNKIFYAAIKVQFRNFVQTEYFKVISLAS